MISRMSLVLGGILLSLVVSNQTQPRASNPSRFPSVTNMTKSVAQFTVVATSEGRRKQLTGTCFFIIYMDARLGENRGFSYLVTNRHMAQPSENGRPWKVTDYWVRHRSKDIQPNARFEGHHLAPADSVPWNFSQDPSVDLAVIPFSIVHDSDDIIPVPSTMFATKEMFDAASVGVGDSLVFAGLFYQVPGALQFQPILRHGMLAMIPEEKLQTTTGYLGNLYLADVHAFHGNSGSPVFVNGGYNPQTGRTHMQYYLMGILSGYIIEEKDFKVRASTTLSGKLPANSDVATIVPVDELVKILELPLLREAREKHVRDLERNH